MIKKNSLWVGSIFGIGFMIFMLSIWSDPERLLWIDQFFLHVPEHRTASLDTFFHYLAMTATIIPISGSFLVVSCWLIIRRCYFLSLWVMGNHVLISGLGKVVKDVVARPRPQVTGSDLRTSFSFPSGHVLLAATLVTTIILVVTTVEWNRPTPINHCFEAIFLMIGVVYILLIMTSRIYLGVHYLSDMIASLLLANAVSLLTYQGYVWISQKGTRR